MREERERESDITYLLRFADDVGDSSGGFRKDGININSIQVNISGDVKARHL